MAIAAFFFFWYLSRHLFTIMLQLATHTKTHKNTKEVVHRKGRNAHYLQRVPKWTKLCSTLAVEVRKRKNVCGERQRKQRGTRCVRIFFERYVDLAKSWFPAFFVFPPSLLHCPLPLLFFSLPFFFKCRDEVRASNTHTHTHTGYQPLAESWPVFLFLR
jgi:hypothetical protein